MENEYIRLWRVSFDIHLPYIRSYAPQVPKSVMRGEDRTTPRICFCSTIEGCLSAMPGDRRDMQIGVSLLAFPFDVRRDDPFLVTPRQLIDLDLVPDAALTGEFWYTAPKPITLKGWLFVIDGFEFSSCVAATEKHRPAIYEALRQLGVPKAYIEELDRYRPETIVNDILNNEERFWEFDDLLGDVVASRVDIPNGIIFDDLRLRTIGPAAHICA